MSTINRGPLGSAFLINRDPTGTHGTNTGTNANTSNASSATAFAPEPPARPAPAAASGPAASSTAIPMPGPTLTVPSAEAAPALTTNFAAPGAVPAAPPKGSLVTTDLVRSLAEVKGQAQFLLYLADQIEDSLHQLIDEPDACQNHFLCRILSMYSTQLETKHHGLGDKIAETCQEVYVTVRDYDHS